ncbi:hypothetical protein ACWCRC_40190, partial [Streptomyces sp. NPDC001940]
ADGELDFERGGNHLMFENLKQTPKEGDKVSVRGDPAQPAHRPSVFARSVRVADDTPGCEAEVLDGFVEDSLSFGSQGDILGFVRGDSRVSVLGHPPHDMGEAARCVSDSPRHLRKRSRTLKNDDFASTMSLSGQGNEAAYLLIDIGQVGVVRPQRVQD